MAIKFGKKRRGIYRVRIGNWPRREDGEEYRGTENWDSTNVIAYDVAEVVKIVKLNQGDFISQVELLGRED